MTIAYITPPSYDTNAPPVRVGFSVPREFLHVVVGAIEEATYEEAWEQTSPGHVPVPLAREVLQGVYGSIFEMKSARIRQVHNVAQPHGTTQSPDMLQVDYNHGGIAYRVDPTTGRRAGFIVPDDGVYLLTGGVSWAFNSTGWRLVQVWNVSTAEPLARVTVQANTSSVAPAFSVATIAELEKGQAIELRCRQDSLGTLDIIAVGGVTHFSISRLM